jgi:serine protease
MKQYLPRPIRMALVSAWFDGLADTARFAPDSGSCTVTPSTAGDDAPTPRRPTPWLALAWVWFVAIISLLATGAWVQAHAAAEAGPKQGRFTLGAPDASVARVIVKYRSGSALMQSLAAGSQAPVQPLHAAALSRRMGLSLSDGRVLGGRTQALRGDGVSTQELVRQLQSLSDVEWAVEDSRRTINAIPNDPYYGPDQTAITPAAGQWYLRAPDSTLVSAINVPSAWDLTTGSPSVTVAVLDTGVRPDHPDFTDRAGKSKLYAGYDFVSDASNAADGGGRDGDASDPGDYHSANQCGLGSGSSNSSWHGTHVAGLIAAATDNSIGMAGLGRDVMVLPVRVLGRCGGNDSDIIAAMRWAAGLSSSPVVNSHPAKIINMSLGSSGSCPSSYQDVFNELAAAGVTVVVAAGNDTGLKVAAPANCNGALAVAGLRHTGTKVGYSSLGAEVAISAPAGNCVNTSGTCLYPLLTTTNAGTTTPAGHTYSDGTNYSVGTSFAAPLVSGAVALMMSVDGSLSPGAIRSALRSTARGFPSSGAGSDVQACEAPSATEQVECYCTTTTCGAGMLNVGAAVAAVAPAPISPPTADIQVSNAAPAVGDTLTLSGTGSVANGGRAIASYAWQITSGQSLAALNGATTGSTASLTLSATGSVTVRLTVTDSAGATGSTTTTLAVAAAMDGGSGKQPASSTASSSTGGGAASMTWVSLLGVSVLALRRWR